MKLQSCHEIIKIKIFKRKEKKATNTPHRCPAIPETVFLGEPGDFNLTWDTPCDGWRMKNMSQKRCDSNAPELESAAGTASERRWNKDASVKVIRLESDEFGSAGKENIEGLPPLDYFK